jgi:hypothetical protein
MVHGAVLDFVTPGEAAQIIPRPAQITRIRASQTIQLGATGGGQDEVYKVPAGYEFAVRRITINLMTATDPNTGNVTLSTAGKYVAYLRSGQFMEYGQPGYGAALQVPGVQSWGEQQGPYLRNGEVFEVMAVGLTANTQLLVMLEGLLARPSSDANA